MKKRVQADLERSPLSGDDEKEHRKHQRVDELVDREDGCETEPMPDASKEALDEDER